MKIEKRKVYGTIIGITLFVVFILGITYAVFQWVSGTSNDTNLKLTVNKDLEKLIIYKQGDSILSTSNQTLEASETYSGGISTVIEFYKKPTNKTIYGRINMEILNMLSSTDTTDANIKKTDTIKWAITTYTITNATEVLLNEGTFNGKNINDKFPLHQDFELTTTRTFFKIYLWFDLNAVDEEKSVSGELLSTEISAEATDMMSVYEIPAKVTLEKLGLTANTNTPDFSKTSCSSGCGESTVGLYKTEDDFGDTYYFRGNVENNYVYFANKYWRIIRINGDGSVRMIYAGTSAHENGYDDSGTKDTSIGTSAFNSSNSDNAYVGYMYGTASSSTYSSTHANTNDSTIKTAIDTWYNNNIKNTIYEQYVVDTIYCNDREVQTLDSSYTGDGSGTTITAYKARERNYANKTPSLKCNQVNDRFTVNSKVSEVTSNGKLTNPIALITADEVAYAGGTWNTGNSKYYLYTKDYYWTMSSSYFNGSNAFELGVVGTGGLSSGYVNNSLSIRPVISISPNDLVGSGTMYDPYKIAEPKPNTPDLVDGLIPITYNESTSAWVKADSTNTDNSWYNYDNKSWANAVLVSSTNRSTYQNADPGTVIAESDILAHYVWIPRFKYKVWNINKVIGTDSYNARTTGIDIVFENEKASTGTIDCTYSYAAPSSSAGSSNETCNGSNGDYYTHPAFTFGSDNLRGFWIGKYELSSESPGSDNGGGTSNTLTPRILPNVVSWRYNTVSNFNTVVQNMQVSSNIYGLNTSRTNTDSHQITNMEWGAVTYLTNSKYGRCTGDSCTEVSVNNCSSYITGIGADSVSAVESSTTCTIATNKYNGDKGVLASTTGNVTGVYDMSGGAWEYVMGNASGASGSFTFASSNSGFVSSWYTTSTEKYLTPYAYGDNNSDQSAYNRARLGDASGETVSSAGRSWNNDLGYFYYSTNRSWLSRGGTYSNGANAGIFYFNRSYGGMDAAGSSRAVLVSLK